MQRRRRGGVEGIEGERKAGETVTVDKGRQREVSVIIVCSLEWSQCMLYQSTNFRMHSWSVVEKFPLIFF